MKNFVSMATVCLFLFMPVAQAGTLQNGEWTAGDCGAKPVAPQIDAHDAEAYNQSVTAINQWQQQANSYYECQVREANKDAGIIAAKARLSQEEYRQIMDGVTATMDAAKKKLEQP
ncbi:MAG: hypothetical protein PHW13_07630 [Methylococcales bacterium]|nr:hypothetical protein [Methylococcales bacterium]